MSDNRIAPARNIDNCTEGGRSIAGDLRQSIRSLGQDDD
jgi:hypothetical protein